MDDITHCVAPAAHEGHHDDRHHHHHHEPGDVVPAVLPALEPAVLPALADSEEEEEENAPLLGTDGRSPPVHSTVIYCVFYLLGMGTLLPWNFFVTADSYWNYKFRDTNSSSDDDGATTELQYNFFGYLSVASMVPNTIFLTLNAVFGHRVNQQTKLVGSLLVVIIFFVATTVLVPINSDSWQTAFFAITMVIVVFLNIFAAVFQGGLFGVAAQFPARYLSAVISGQALGAVFACIARIVSIAVSGSDPDAAAVTSALVYFILADITMAVSIVAFIWMARTPFYKYFLSLSGARSGSEDAMVSPAGDDKRPTLSVWAIFMKIKWYALSVCLVFTVTLCLYPAVQAKIKVVGDPDTVWAKNYFVPVCCFLLFNGCDYLGRIAGGFTVWPRPHHWYLVLGMVVLRAGFVPLFMYCNVEHTHLTTVFDSDVWFVVFMVLFGLSNGYLSTLCMIFGPGLVEPEEQNTASSMMAASLGLGLCLGALLSNAAIKVL